MLAVPDGTVVTDASTGEVLADLVGAGAEIVAAGGRGGLGNAALASASRKAPGFALLGEEGETRDDHPRAEGRRRRRPGRLPQRRQVLAGRGHLPGPAEDRRLPVHHPGAQPRRRVAGDVTYTVADVPGLIEGASEGRGLGHDFLRHIERCAALVHVIDCATFEPGRDPLTDLDVIEAELAAHGGLEDRPRLVALNKIDVPDARRAGRDGRAPTCEARGPAGLRDLDQDRRRACRR